LPFSWALHQLSSSDKWVMTKKLPSSHQRKFTTFCQPMLRTSQTTWIQIYQHSQNQLESVPAELLSTLKLMNKEIHAKSMIIAQIGRSNQYQDHQISMIKLVLLSMMLPWKVVMLFLTSEILLVMNIQNHSTHNSLLFKMIVNTGIRESVKQDTNHGYINSQWTPWIQSMVIEAQPVQNMDGIHRTNIQRKLPMDHMESIQ
jgi:hypothetical protein